MLRHTELSAVSDIMMIVFKTPEDLQQIVDNWKIKMNNISTYWQGFYPLLLIQLCDKQEQEEENISDEVWLLLRSLFSSIHCLKSFHSPLGPRLNTDRVKDSLVRLKTHQQICHEQIRKYQNIVDHQPQLRTGWICEGLCGIETLPLDIQPEEKISSQRKAGLLQNMRNRIHGWRNKSSNVIKQ